MSFNTPTHSTRVNPMPNVNRALGLIDFSKRKSEQIAWIARARLWRKQINPLS